MATTLFFRNPAVDADRADYHTATDDPKLIGPTASPWKPALLSTTRGSGVVSVPGNTVAGATLGVEVDEFGITPWEWISLPLATDVTISGTITANIWASESNMSANVAINVVIDKISRTNAAVTLVVKSTRTTEEAVTTRAAANFTTGMTSGAYTGVAFNRGDRIRVRIFGDDAGTMGSGFTFDAGVAGTTGSADGDSFVTFTENLTFETSDPAGSTLYLTTTSAGINPGASTELEMWTARGSGSTNAATTTVAGWTANPGTQITDTGGGTTLEWYSKQLTAFTLGGKHMVNLRCKTSTGSTETMSAQLAVCDSDGTNATVVAWAPIAPSVINGASAPDLFGGALTTTDNVYRIYLTCDDTSVANGQRLRLRLYVDDVADSSTSSGRTVTATYAGTSAAAAGDTYLVLAQSVTEFTAAAGSDPLGLWTERRTPRRRSLQRM